MVIHIYEYIITLEAEIRIRKDHYDEKDIQSHLEKMGTVQKLRVTDIVKEEQKE